MKLLIDTNVLLDMVLKRNGYDISVEHLNALYIAGDSSGESSSN